MRVTNSMISNSSKAHIDNAKNKLLTAENQYTTQKKILRPSDDPTIAIRSLQLRTTYGQIMQYVDKNVQDALEWMDTTETAMANIDKILTNMKERLNYGAEDDKAVDERNSILSVLKGYANAIFEDSANADYSGRFVFTGYRTDTSLLFPEDTDTLEYEIVENFTSKNIDTIKYVSGGATYDENNNTADAYAAQVPKQDSAYRIQLAYDKCSDTAMTVTGNNAAGQVISFGLYTPDGTAVTTPAISVATCTQAQLDAVDGDYSQLLTGTDNVLYLPETGELILKDTVYQAIHQNGAEIKVTYNKKEFEKNDIRPEMYFECRSYNRDTAKNTTYVEPRDQEIRYEVNFSQTSTVNIQARDAFSTDIYRAVDYIERMVNAMDEVERQISEVDKKIANTPDIPANQSDLAAYKKLKEVLESEKSLRRGCMTEAFAMGLTMVDEVQAELNVAIAAVGTKYNRLQLTFERLSDQKVDTEEKLSNNEDINIADAYINLTQADNLYQSSLMATSRILGNNLLNYI